MCISNRIPGGALAGPGSYWLSEILGFELRSTVRRGLKRTFPWKLGDGPHQPPHHRFLSVVYAERSKRSFASSKQVCRVVHAPHKGLSPLACSPWQGGWALSPCVPETRVGLASPEGFLVCGAAWSSSSLCRSFWAGCLGMTVSIPDGVWGPALQG